MVNINKIKTLAKNQGITIAFICKQLGNGRGYLNDVANGKNTMPDERIRKTAQILGTTFEYLTDQTDDPKPKNKKPPEIISNADIISDGKNIYMIPLFENAAYNLLADVWKLRKSHTYRTLVEISGISNRQIAIRYSIPMRTAESWRAGKREMPPYFLDLMAADILTKKYK